MTSPNAAIEWRWSDERGVQRSVRLDELRAALNNKVLAPSTLVWCSGMTEWVPASAVPELAGSIPKGAPAAPVAKPKPVAVVAAAPAKPVVSGRTLTGMTAPSAPAKEGGGRAELPSLPIVVPAAGGAQEAARRTAITQPPAYDAGAVAAEAMPAIPKAAAVPAALAAAAAAPTSGRGERVSLWPEQTFEDEEEIVSTFVDDGKDAGKHEALPPPKPAAPEPTATFSVPKPPAKKPAAAVARAPKAEAPAPQRAPNPAGFSPTATMPGIGSPKARAPADRRGEYPALVPRKEASKPAVTAAKSPAAASPEKPAAPEATKTAALSAAAPKAAFPVEQTVRFSPMRPEQVLGPAKAASVFGVRSAAAEKTGVTAAPAPRAAPAQKRPETPAEDPRKHLQTARSLEFPPVEAAKTKPPAAEPHKAAPEKSEAAAKPVVPRAEPAPSEAHPEAPAVQDAQAPQAPVHAHGADDEDKHQRYTPTAPLTGVSSPNLPEVLLPPPPKGAESPILTTASLPAPSLGVSPLAESSPAPPWGQEMPPDHNKAAPERSVPPRASLPRISMLDRREQQNADAQRIAGLAGVNLPSQSTVRTRPRPSADAPRDRPHSSQRPFDEPVAVSMSSIVGLGGVLVAMTVAAFLVGRCSMGSAPAASSGPPHTLEPALSLVGLLARAAVPQPLKPCWVSRQPVRWAPAADKSVPFDLSQARPGVFALGYARSENTAAGLEIDAASGEVTEKLSSDTDSPIERVSPSLDAAGFVIITEAQASSVAPVAHVPHPQKPFFVGVGGAAVTSSEKLPAASPAVLFPMQGEGDANAVRVQALGDQGYAIVYRKGMSIWGGVIDSAQKPSSGLVQIEGSGGAVGKPSAGFNGKEFAVIFADRPAPGSSYEMRLGVSPAGSLPTSTSVIPLPKGGPGGDAFSPDIAGLPDGRWLLVWTEGSPGNRAIRAQTLAPDRTPLGDPIALSPPAGNFGQGVLGVTEGYVSVVFLSQGKAGYELWGAMLQCG